MKNLIFSLAIATLFIAACNNGAKETSSNTKNGDTASVASSEVSASASPIESILNPYFELKNALTEDDDKAAGEAGKEMVKALESFDKSSLNDEQSKVYSDIHEDAKEHAEHIAANVGNIKHQREHFETLSEEIYELAKSVGGKKLYYVNCPMYNNNKGANWVSEVKEIRNPYLGKEMLECGTVKEELK
jgi:hypothetical protein